MTARALVRALPGGKWFDSYGTARCPAHDDQVPSLSIRDGANDAVLLKCHAGCQQTAVIDALKSRGLWKGREGSIPSDNRATAQPASGSPASSVSPAVQGNLVPTKPEQTPPMSLTLEQYAVAKALPIEFLVGCGLTDFVYGRKPAVRMPYLGEGGEQVAVRFRIAPEGDRFRWKSGTKPCLYGLDRLPAARTAGYVVLVEGESDCHTLWFHGVPALGVPGAGNWREERDARHLDGIETIYVVIEPDGGGDAVHKWLSRSTIRDRVKLVGLSTKDPSGLHLEDPDQFKERWRTACLAAIPWSTVEAKASAEERSEAWNTSSELAGMPSILDEFGRDLSRIGVVGERRATKLIYLALTSRLLDRPVSMAIKGPSSGGKSFVVESTLKFFPPTCFYALTAMSDRALAYSSEPLKHRHLVIYEAAGMASDFATYLIRSLLSEGRLCYETVEKTRDGLVPRLIEREGPTGLIVTTTSLRLHPENETRMLSLAVTDTNEQTAAVFRALAGESNRPQIDLTRWLALQTWLATGTNQVAVPFAGRLAELVPPVAVRLRRDFKTILMLVRAHALLHQALRQTNDDGLIVATVDDYAAVRNLVADLVAEGVDATVRPEIREVVDIVGGLIAGGCDEVRQVDLNKALRLHKSAVSRRVATAVDAGFLKNLEDRKGRPARLVLGEPLPDELEILPAPDRLCGEIEGLRGCAGDGGDTEPALCNKPGQTNSTSGPSAVARRSTKQWTARI